MIIAIQAVASCQLQMMSYPRGVVNLRPSLFDTLRYVRISFYCYPNKCMYPILRYLSCVLPSLSFFKGNPTNSSLVKQLSHSVYYTALFIVFNTLTTPIIHAYLVHLIWPVHFHLTSTSTLDIAA